MGRPSGTTREQAAERRHQLAIRVGEAIRDQPDASIRALAEHAGVSVATLQHHFGDRDGAVEAALIAITDQGRPFMERYARRHPDGLAAGVRELVRALQIGWGGGLGAILTSGLRLGLGDARFGPLFVDQLLEPTLQTAEALLEAHADELSGEVDRRGAALALISPVLLALLHQEPLSGSRCRPLDVPAFASDHVERWLRGYSMAQ